MDISTKNQLSNLIKIQPDFLEFDRIVGEARMLLSYLRQAPGNSLSMKYCDQVIGIRNSWKAAVVLNAIGPGGCKAMIDEDCSMVKLMNG